MRIIVLHKEKNWAASYADDWILADTNNHTECIQKVSQYLNSKPKKNFDGILTFWEENVLLTAVLTDKFNLTGKFDYRYTKGKNYGEDDPGSSSTLQVGLEYNIVLNATIDVFYKVYQVPSNTTDKTSDVLGLVFMYRF